MQMQEEAILQKDFSMAAQALPLGVLTGRRPGVRHRVLRAACGDSRTLPLQIV